MGAWLFRESAMTDRDGDLAFALDRRTSGLGMSLLRARPSVILPQCTCVRQSPFHSTAIAAASELDSHPLAFPKKRDPSPLEIFHFDADTTDFEPKTVKARYCESCRDNAAASSP